jgi:capsid protein
MPPAKKSPAKRTTAKRVPTKATELDYDATKTTPRRRPPSSKVTAEHVILPDSKRKKMLGTVQDQVRNASVAAWMIRRHLDYVARFKFQFRTGNEQLDRLVNRLFDWHAQPRNFDVASRFGREEGFRMFEMECITAGDAAMVKLADLHLQAIESDMIAFPKVGKWNNKTKQYDRIDRDLADKVDADTGVVLDQRYPGRVLQYCICNRGKDGKQTSYDHLESAANVIFDGYFTRYSSQVRGVSPLSTAINTIQDIYEGIDYALAKAKVHQLFGLALMRDYSGAADDQEEVNQFGMAAGQNPGTDEAMESASETEAGTKQIATSMQEVKPGQMMMVDMDLKGRIDTIESKTPSTEFQNFEALAIRLALLALDIPYTAFDSRASNFAGLIADNNMYENACRHKREKNKWRRIDYGEWLLERAWNGATEFPLRQVANAAGITRLRDLQDEAEWVPSGMPWLQKLQEIQGDIKAISIGADNPISVCKRRGQDFFENIDKTAQAYEYAASKGVPLMIGEPGQATVAEEVEKTEDGDE